MTSRAGTPAPGHGRHADLPLGASLFTIFLCILFGANAVAAKITLAGLGVFTTVGIRFAIASLVLTLWAIASGVSLVFNRGQIRRLAPLTLIFFLQIALFYAGQKRTTAAHGTLIANVLPFVVMILAHYFIPGDRVTLRKVGGLVLGFTGVLVLFADSATLTGEALTGDVLILLAVLVWGANVIYVKRIIDDFHSLQLALFPMATSVPLFFACGLLSDEHMVSYIDRSVVGAMLYQALVTASFGFVAWNRLMRRFGATALHSFVFIMPVSGVFLGVVMLGEPLTAHLLASIALVVTGLVVVNRIGVSARGSAGS